MKKYRYFKCKNKHCKKTYSVEKVSDEKIKLACPKCFTINTEIKIPNWRITLRQFLYRLNKSLNLQKNIRWIRPTYIMIQISLVMLTFYYSFLLLIPIILIMIFMCMLEFLTNMLEVGALYL